MPDFDDFAWMDAFLFLHSNRSMQALMSAVIDHFLLYNPNCQYQYTPHPILVYDFYIDSYSMLDPLLSQHRHWCPQWLTKHLCNRRKQCSNHWYEISLLVVTAAATKPRWKIFLNRVDISKLFAPPVTDMIKSGVVKHQPSLRNRTTVSALVSSDNRIYCDKRVSVVSSLWSNFI